MGDNRLQKKKKRLSSTPYEGVWLEVINGNHILRNLFEVIIYLKMLDYSV